MKITNNFSLEGMVITQHRELIEANIEWARAHAANLTRLCVELLEPVREILGNNVMIISSGIRCPALNALVSKSPGSAHIPGFAADFIAPGFGSPYEVCQRLAAELPARGIKWDQLIYEHTWTHIALIQPVTMAQRGQVRTLMPGNQYAEGIILKGAAA